jgi:hypothetical protein
MARRWAGSSDGESSQEVFEHKKTEEAENFAKQQYHSEIDFKD